ncbi:hypothetical protein E0W80_01870 [Microbacterium sp. PI-1]|uniref:tyrosine-type recombinase/integrase n=1 Tax=Microbacterium sp. PI-1 TaxID=2545631 RepID=UPI00103AB177|nr:tyrosine-type recombinase/integrase [Microbacterium sp. PI-1]TCJ29810.1 hypothetical protein E0W80_01870 [Microbacterium sp. PI-1]
MSREAWGALRRLPSKRWQASFIVDGVRHTGPTTFDTKGAARAYLSRTQAEIAAGTWLSKEDAAAARQAAADERAAAERDAERRALPFSAFATDWLSKRYSASGKPIRETTRAEYRRLLDGPLASLADIPVSSIDRAAVEDWHAAALATGRVTQAARAYALLSSILRSAVSRGMLAEAPEPIRGAASAKTGKPVKPPTPEELAVIIAEMPERLRSFVIVAAWSGLRSGEMRELRRGDVVVTRDAGAVVGVALRVSRAVTHTTGATKPHIGAPKTGAGVRVVPLPAVAYRPLLSHMADRVPLNPDALLWPAADGVANMRQSTFARHWKNARESAGRPDLPLHGLRHYAASHYSAAGATSREVADRLGQASEGIALRYTHGTGREASLVEALDAAALTA